MNYIEIKRNKQGITAEVNYGTTLVKLNEVKMFGKMSIMILVTIPNNEDDKATLNLEIYNENLEDKYWGNNYIQFSCYLSEIDNYQFDEVLEDFVESILDDEEIKYPYPVGK